MRFTDAVGWAYGVLDGEGEGVGEGKGDGGRRGEGEEGGDEVSVVVEYNEGGLDVWVLDEAWVVKPRGHIMFPDLGVEAIIDSSAADTYFLTVQRRLEGFLRKFVGKEDEDGDGKGVVMGLKAVVLAGDASEKGMRGMKAVVEKVLREMGYVDADGKGLVRDEIEGLYVGAVGAAKRGRDMLMFPGRFKGRESGSEREHGEL